MVLPFAPLDMEARLRQQFREVFNETQEQQIARNAKALEKALKEFRKNNHQPPEAA